MTTIPQKKTELRNDIYQQLSKLTPEKIILESKRIQEVLKAYLLSINEVRTTMVSREGKPSRAIRVAAYHAMGLEADLHDLISDPELSAFVDFYLPRSVRDDGDLALHFALWPKHEKSRQPENWVTAWYGAIEPPPWLAKPDLQFDLILLPCVAVSPYGERLGHGKGYYDRFIKTQTVRTEKLAICLSPQAVNYHLPVEEHDQFIDGRVTAAKGIEYAQKSSD